MSLLITSSQSKDNTNSIGIEADEVEAIHEKWQFDKVRDSMMETDRAFKEKTSEKS